MRSLKVSYNAQAGTRKGVKEGDLAVTNKMILENLPFDKSWKKQFLRYFGKFDAKTNFLVHDILRDTWQTVYWLRHEEILKSRSFLNKWAGPANMQQLGAIDQTWLDQKIGEDLIQCPHVFSRDVVSNAEQLLRYITGIK